MFIIIMKHLMEGAIKTITKGKYISIVKDTDIFNNIDTNQKTHTENEK